MSKSDEPVFYLPLPPRTTVSEDAPKEVHLKEVTKNLDAHHGRIRANIIASACTRLALVQSETLANNDDSRMDLDDVLTTPPHPAVREKHLLSNLKAGFVGGSGDRDNAAATTTNTTPGQTRKPPKEIAALAEALRQIQRYDRHQRETKKFYTSALERQQQRTVTESEGGETVENSRRPSTGTEERSRRVSFTGIEDRGDKRVSLTGTGIGSQSRRVSFAGTSTGSERPIVQPPPTGPSLTSPAERNIPSSISMPPPPTVGPLSATAQPPPTEPRADRESRAKRVMTSNSDNSRDPRRERRRR